MKPIRPYGSWPSSISAAHVAAAGRKFADLTVDRGAADGPRLYWLESRPEEAGRNTIMTLSEHGAISCLDAPASARSSVHEYGGGAFTVHAGFIWFVNAADQAIWMRDPEGQLSTITDPGTDLRYADLQYDARYGRLIAIAEDLDESRDEPVARVVSIHRDGRVHTLAEGHDFYASPRLSPAADRLVWLAWNHPNMPWDVSELWQAPIDDAGQIGEPAPLWQPTGVSLFGPVFNPDGRLHVVADIDDWWNIHRESADGGFEALTAEQGEFGVPQWVFGQSTYDFTDDGRLFALITQDGIWHIGEVDCDTGAVNRLRHDCNFFEQITALGNRVAVVAASPARAKHIRRLDFAAAGEVLRSADSLPADAALSRPEPMSWPTGEGETAHGLFYPPASERWSAPADERPPLILKCHGGPTGATDTALDARIQYWTSRGYAVLDVNYRGSTGYGRAYRHALAGRWGVADVEDCRSGAAHLAEADRIDADRVLISGSSAGGYTVLSVLAFTDLAAAGASYYGIGDLKRLLASTHKFESRYLERLIGRDDATLIARSPLYHADQLSCPVLFLQGGQDKVVPPDQAESMVEALAGRGVPVAYVRFESERHGFRNADNVMTAIEAERSFYSRVLRISDVEDLEPLEIENFDDA
ncbi:alpha/beta hydrolase family protein [Salinisphaera sp.]|uniref:alpha/beta hydrolase family protein n=1 Tax=Salinisphaera sp. TaxID=1914330 RepID=UPI002D7733A7|nr:prolyl oligopeptidase family serine peptidase [Salinisphaera sp.]HET7313307.1 prolyl oligopeptidase family serine peptidase [Salinisphaera sp.]